MATTAARCTHRTPDLDVQVSYDLADSVCYDEATRLLNAAAALDFVGDKVDRSTKPGATILDVACRHSPILTAQLLAGHPRLPEITDRCDWAINHALELCTAEADRLHAQADQISAARLQAKQAA